MLSAGKFHREVPRDVEGNIAWREHLLQACQESAATRRAVLRYCQEDILFWINTFAWQFNPNSLDSPGGAASLEEGPFITWKKQEEVIERILYRIVKRGDVLIEKSRELGSSWLCLLVQAWFLFIYPRRTKFLCISRNEDTVDRAGDADSLFWKVDYILAHLPEWMAELNPKTGIRRNALMFVNNETGASITGQATTEKMGVGGRCTAMFLDEFSQVPNAFEVYDRTSDTTGCRIFSGTHKGTGTCFHMLSQPESGYAIDKIVLHWSDHPDKNKGMYHWDKAQQRVIFHDPTYQYDREFVPVVDGRPDGGPFPGLRSPWYDGECKRKSRAQGIAADLDINPTGSAEQLFDAAVIHHLKVKYGREPAKYDLEYDRETGKPVALHPHSTGLFRLWHRVHDGKPPRAHYAFAADISQGLGKATASCLSGMNAETGEKVFEYANPSIEPKEFAFLSMAVCYLYRSPDEQPAMLGWEKGGPGNTFGKHVLLMKYPRVYCRRTEHRLNSSISDEPGWANTPDAMMALMISYRDALRSGKCLNRSENALSECLHFAFGKDGYIYHTGVKNALDNSAAKVNHGDMTIADAIAWKLVEDMKKLVQLDTTTDTTKPLLYPPMSLSMRRQMAKAATSRY